ACVWPACSSVGDRRWVWKRTGHLYSFHYRTERPGQPMLELLDLQPATTHTQTHTCTCTHTHLDTHPQTHTRTRTHAQMHNFLINKTHLYAKLPNSDALPTEHTQDRQSVV